LTAISPLRRGNPAKKVSREEGLVKTPGEMWKGQLISQFRHKIGRKIRNIGHISL
jgi:hypothetical protein